jgi:hypothetical protein
MGACKMKTTVFLFASLLTVFAPRSFAAGTQSPDSSKDEAVVYYYDFGIQRITGIHEEEIDGLGCKFAISKKQFIAMLSETKDHRSYQPLDVRANVIFSTTEHYFIDRAGTVHGHDREFIIDKKMFALAIKQRGECRPK